MLTVFMASSILGQIQMLPPIRQAAPTASRPTRRSPLFGERAGAPARGPALAGFVLVAGSRFGPITGISAGESGFWFWAGVSGEFPRSKGRSFLFWQAGKVGESSQRGADPQRAPYKESIS